MKTILHHKLLIVSCLLFLSAMTAEAKSFVVIVDIQDYPGVESDFLFAVNNRKIVEKAMTSSGEDVEIATFTNEQATTDNILKALRKVAYNATTEDALILYFSGHGYDGGFKTYDSHLKYTDLRKVLKMCVCSRKMVFADACHTGSLRSKKKKKDSGVQKWESNVMLFLSSRGNEESHYSSVFSASVFTHYLCLGLGGAADLDSNKIVSAKELFNYVSTNVATFMQEKQHPVMWGNFPADMTVITIK